MIAAVKFRGAAGHYDVLLDGEVIGTVERWEKGFNLTRYIVIRGWRARTVDGRSLFRSGSCTGETRGEAVEALIADRDKS